jgi:polysaccharide pyruvyl transferase WcaK-like protein
MKVAILTQPLGHNYGGLLQAYALQKAICIQGGEVITIDRRNVEQKTPIMKRCTVLFKNLARLTLGRIKNLPSKKKANFIFANLREFKAQHIITSVVITQQDELIDYFKNNEFDVMIVGSDQVWRPKYSPKLENYFFDFYDLVDSKAKRISYAASFGVDKWEFSKHQTSECKILLNKFDAVSVREDSAVELCKTHCGVEAIKIVDPTLLLDSCHYKSLIPDCDVLGAQGKVLNYILDPAEDKQAIALKVSQLLSKDSLSIKPDNYINAGPSQIESCQYPRVEVWLQSFFLCDFVVTDSFHGCVFAIIFNKPFVAVGNLNRGLARFESLLSMFDLKERLLQSVEDVTKEIVSVEINWVEIERKRLALAEEGNFFLKKHIEKGAR